MSYIDSIYGCCKKRWGIHKRAHVYTERVYTQHAYKNQKDTYTRPCVHTHTQPEKEKKLKSERQDNNNNNNNNNNKKEAGAFLDSAFGCCKNPRKSTYVPCVFRYEANTYYKTIQTMLSVIFRMRSFEEIF